MRNDDDGFRAGAGSDAAHRRTGHGPKDGEDVAGARLGFVADRRGAVIAHFGAGIEEVDGELFLVRVRSGEGDVDHPAEGIAYDDATGLLLLRVDEELPTPYTFASVAAGPGRLVYGATAPQAGEGVGFGVHRGIVQSVELTSQSDLIQPDWIRVSESTVLDGVGVDRRYLTIAAMWWESSSTIGDSSTPPRFRRPRRQTGWVGYSEMLAGHRSGLIGNVHPSRSG